MKSNTFTKSEFVKVIAWMSGVLEGLPDNDKKYDIEIKEHHEKRSQSANSYFWVLCSELADAMSKDKTHKYTKEDIYRKEIEEHGISYDDEIAPEQVPRRQKAWSMIGLGWFSKRVDFSADGNKEVIRFYYGSSMYSTKQMHNLLQGVIQDCQALNIDTRTPNEINEMLSLWATQKEVVK